MLNIRLGLLSVTLGVSIASTVLAMDRSGPNATVVARPAPPPANSAALLNGGPGPVRPLDALGLPSLPSIPVDGAASTDAGIDAILIDLGGDGPLQAPEPDAPDHHDDKVTICNLAGGGASTGEDGMDHCISPDGEEVTTPQPAHPED